VFKKGGEAHVNNVELGRFGRNRTNVWAYAGANSFRQGRDDELAMHPTVKPVALIEDAIKDVSRRGALVLDPFGGSGSTLIAAERCGRSARLIELDPLYCDVIVRRFETCTGKTAGLADSDQCFEAVAAGRQATAA
jgi:DNA modification methylase